MRNNIPGRRNSTKKETKVGAWLQDAEVPMRRPLSGRRVEERKNSGGRKALSQSCKALMAKVKTFGLYAG